MYETEQNYFYFIRSFHKKYIGYFVKLNSYSFIVKTKSFCSMVRKNHREMNFRKFFSVDQKSAHQKNAFTLVELIVVITILAILWTIAFISLQWFARDARDSQRLNDVRAIEKKFSVLRTEWNKLPQPDEAITITASGTVISYQWKVWSWVLRNIQQAWEIFDPILNEPYTYSVNENRTKYQMLVYYENSESIAQIIL